MNAMFWVVLMNWPWWQIEGDECAGCGGKGHTAPHCPWRKDR